VSLETEQRSNLSPSQPILATNILATICLSS